MFLPTKCSLQAWNFLVASYLYIKLVSSCLSFSNLLGSARCCYLLGLKRQEEIKENGSKEIHDSQFGITIKTPAWKSEVPKF